MLNDLKMNFSQICIKKNVAVITWKSKIKTFICLQNYGNAVAFTSLVNTNYTDLLTGNI